jgi:hypothetical protein
MICSHATNTLLSLPPPFLSPPSHPVCVRFGEDIFRSWSSLECSPAVLRGSMDLFAGTGHASSGAQYSVV